LGPEPPDEGPGGTITTMEARDGTPYQLETPHRDRPETPKVQQVRR
jgi:hypothetical protein